MKPEVSSIHARFASKLRLSFCQEDKNVEQF